MKAPEDPIDALLREQNAHLDDQGFTARVMKELPRRRRPWLHLVVIFGAVGIGTVLALYWLPLDQLPALDASVLRSLDSAILLPWVTALVVVASLIGGVVSLLRWED